MISTGPHGVLLGTFFLLHQKPELENQQPQQMATLPWFFPSIWPLTLTREQSLPTVCELVAHTQFPSGLNRPSVDECLLPELPCLSLTATETGTLENSGETLQTLITRTS